MKSLINEKKNLLAGFVIFILFCACETNSRDNDLPGISGKITSHSACKGLKSACSLNLIPDSLSCINYAFETSTGKLTIEHINAAFNCCPDSLYCKVGFSGDTVVVQEFEKKAGCKCNCLYDLHIEISGLAAKKYPVRIIEPYCGEQQPLIFIMDLTKNTEGMVCVNRSLYPWGI